MKSQVPQRYMFLKEVAAYLRISYRKAVEEWASWEQYGVKASEMGNKRLFDIKQIDRMVELRRVN